MILLLAYMQFNNGLFRLLHAIESLPWLDAATGGACGAGYFTARFTLLLLFLLHLLDLAYLLMRSGRVISAKTRVACHDGLTRFFDYYHSRRRCSTQGMEEKRH